MMQMETFLSRYNLRLGLEDLKRETDGFIADMHRGLQGSGSSMAMLPTYIQWAELPKDNRKTVVVDAGGTNLRVATVEFSPNGPKIGSFEKYPMLGTQGTIDAQALFDGLAQYIAPVAKDSSQIGICFSYPSDVQPNRDARIMYFNKEVDVTGAEGMLLGENLQKSLAKLGVTGEKSVVVINDTVATLLGARACNPPGVEYGGYIGLILGTGLNTCYMESNKNIAKIPSLLETPGHTIINIESGGYNGLPQNDIDKAFMARTAFPHKQQLEKMASGAYQSGLLLDYLKAAANEGCFSPSCSEKLLALQTLSAIDVGLFCTAPYGDSLLASTCNGQPDASAIYLLMDAFFDRVGMIAATNLCGILRQLGAAAQDPSRPVCISAEGTTFYKAPLLRSKLDYYMSAYAWRELGIYYRFTQVEDSTLLGTAVAALQGN